MAATGTNLIRQAIAITPAQAVINSLWCGVCTPELSSYIPANGTVVTNIGPGAGGTPVQAPVYRCLTAIGVNLVTGAGITAGAATLYMLGLDGNWYAVTAATTLTATTTFGLDLGPGTAVGSGFVTTTIYGAIPCLAFALIFGVALLGGNVTSLQIVARCQSIDVALDRVATPARI